ncbi:MAG: hypothetical protein JZU62_08790 [Sulfuricurvum sp.]|uniref:hypothetical protein n=1 Tax=Sulfuricurvum sp. TaxID=2025608 RepID=UPI0025FD2982|nr:hypothetical protein [Sulfuricurvum sp.]MBV5321770.1 hypothetical protein [Sulfuricurvum sp.]
MEKNISNDQIYKTSLYGRFGYFIMIFPFLIVSIMFMMGGYEQITSFKDIYEILTGIFLMLLGLGFAIVVLRNLYFIFYFGKRFVLKNDQLEYYGFFRKIKIKWDDIKKVSTNHSLKAYVLLAITTHSNKRGYSMDVSGLKPNYSILVNEIEKRRNGNFNATINQNNPKEL